MDTRLGRLLHRTGVVYLLEHLGSKGVQSHAPITYGVAPVTGHNRLIDIDQVPLGVRQAPSQPLAHLIWKNIGLVTI